MLQQLKSGYTLDATTGPFQIIWTLCQYVINKTRNILESITDYNLIIMRSTVFCCSKTNNARVVDTMLDMY